ncbi:MAG: type III pantothenate kinase [Flavobacteriaceae bacterium]|nr:type III pantothenate kinase [Flavobacteriaceae bacterium]
MNLIIDVGNTKVKLAVFKEQKLVKKASATHKNFLSKINKIQKDYPEIQHSIISSVANISDQDIEQLKSKFKILVLNRSTKVPFKNCYETPTTLGVDRIALVSASVNKYPDKNVLIIDAGTCITYDFITAQDEYLGGAISPGIKMRYNALHNLTANLPLLDIKPPKNLIGNSTSESIHSGIINGILKEIDGIVQEYEKKYQDLTVILTGGDTKFLSKQLKSSIFANSNFLLEGLNFILEYNTNE